jgi:hypothetical protein
MEAVGKYDRLVRKYLKRTKRFKTLKEFQNSLDRKKKKGTFYQQCLQITETLDERKPVRLSFAIQKAPERKKIERDLIEKKPRQKIKKEFEEKKTVVIPEKFIKIANKFGLPKDNLEFFYENRESFHWESMQKTDIHCSEHTCKFTTKASPKCLVEHMISAHNYKDIPCDKIDCSYVGHSYKNFKRHQAQFHGHGMKPTKFGNHACPYSSCKVFFEKPAGLEKHLNIHENKLFTCSYCQYRKVTLLGIQ